jgi:hypothetical protein
MHENVNDQKVGIWLDHRKAVFVFVKDGNVTTKILDSDVGPHARYSNDAAYPTASGPQSGGGEKKHVERNRHELERYYDEVIKEIGQPESVFIVGPGEAKTELKSRMALTHGMAEAWSDQARGPSMTPD